MLIKNQTYDEERALYASRDIIVENCSFEGPADGESALKESRRITVNNCHFKLRYPLWHVHEFEIFGSDMSETCRAPLWYSSNGVIDGLKINGVKCLRECDKIELRRVTAHSPEFGWKCRDVKVENSEIESEYIFLDSERLDVKNLHLTGKYSFQYVKGAHISDCTFNTKDSFWHAEGVTIENSTINGEYFGWYSKNLRLVNCTISGTQPFCYCQNLQLEDCRLIGCDLAFEYSSVNAVLEGSVDSIKNPLTGLIVAESFGEIIHENSVHNCDCIIATRETKRFN